MKGADILSVGGNIKKFRLEQNLTQEELAKKLNVSRPLITQFERGTRTPTILLSNEIATVLGCKIQDLLK